MTNPTPPDYLTVDADDGDYCGSIHDLMRENAARERARISGETLAVWQTNGPRRPDVARDITDACIAVRARRGGR